MNYYPFIVIEGADGAGTTTQARLLADRLRAHNMDPASCLLTRQPSDGPVGKKIRALLTGEDPPLASSAAMQLMFSADRLDHAERVILPALRAGQIVVSDRYDMSTAIYLAAGSPRYKCLVQGCGWTGNNSPTASGFAALMSNPPPPEDVHDHPTKNLETELLKHAFSWNTMAPRPLLTIVLSVSPEVAEERRARGGKPEMFEQIEFQRRVCKLYDEAHRTHQRGESPEAIDAMSQHRPVRFDSPVAVINGAAPMNVVAEEVWVRACVALAKLDEHNDDLAEWMRK